MGSGSSENASCEVQVKAKLVGSVVPGRRDQTSKKVHSALADCLWELEVLTWEVGKALRPRYIGGTTLPLGMESGKGGGEGLRES